MQLKGGLMASVLKSMLNIYKIPSNIVHLRKFNKDQEDTRVNYQRAHSPHDSQLSTQTQSSSPHFIQMEIIFYTYAPQRVTLKLIVLLTVKKKSS